MSASDPLVRLRTAAVAHLPSPHARAALTALFVTGLWTSSYLLIRVGLADIPALTFAGLRYGLAALCLLPVALTRGHHRALATCTRREWARLLALGLLLYAVTQGAQFVALARLHAATVSLLLTFTPAVVFLLSIAILDERPSRGHLLGLAVLSAGVVGYFAPFRFDPARGFGLGVMCLGVLGNALAAVLGRRVNRERSLPPVAVTVASMAAGAVPLLAVGIATQGFPQLSAWNWLVVGWLAVVNTAVAFTCWNHALRTLSAVESSIINNTMLVQVSLLGWVAFGEALSALDLLGLALVGGGALLVQLAGRR